MIDRDGLICKMSGAWLAHYYQDEWSRLELESATAEILGIESRQVSEWEDARLLGVVMFDELAEIAESAIQELKRRENTREIEGRDRMRVAL